MGRNSLRNKAITKMYLPRLKAYCEQLEQQLEALKTDPNTTLGQVITQARELYTQNSRLSVLTAALLEQQGNKVTVKKSAMDRFENHKVLIKWELPEGVEKAEDATEFVFMYEAIKNEPAQPQPVQVGPIAHSEGSLQSATITEESIRGKGPCPDDATVENGFLQEVDPATFNGDPSEATNDLGNTNAQADAAIDAGVDPEIVGELGDDPVVQPGVYTRVLDEDKNERELPS